MNDPLSASLVAETRRIAALGLMACTAGNASARCPDEPWRIVVTPSGVDKAALVEADLLQVDGAGRVLAGAGRPSDETALHLALYHQVGCGAVIHGHPPYAVALSLDAAPQVRFRGIEMLKAFAGTTTHDCERCLPVVDNHQDMAVLAQAVLAARDPDLPAVLVRGHGVYAWGQTVAAAGRHLETVEWLCRLRILAAGLPSAHL